MASRRLCGSAGIDGRLKGLEYLAVREDQDAYWWFCLYQIMTEGESGDNGGLSSSTSA